MFFLLRYLTQKGHLASFIIYMRNFWINSMMHIRPPVCHARQNFDNRFYFMYLPRSDDCLVGLVVKAPASEAENPGFESHLRRDFSGSSHTSDLQIGTPVATLPGAKHYRVSSGTDLPGVSIL